MAALCLYTSLEMLWPLCCRRTLRLQGYLCRCLHKGSPQPLQAVVMLSACHVLQNSPQFNVQEFEVCSPRGPILSTDEGQKVPPQPLLSCLGLLGRNWVLLEDPFLTTEEGHEDVSQLLVARPPDTLRHQFHPFLWTTLKFWQNFWQDLVVPELVIFEIEIAIEKKMYKSLGSAQINRLDTVRR